MPSFQLLFPISKSNHLLIREATLANPITRRQFLPRCEALLGDGPRWQLLGNVCDFSLQHINFYTQLWQYFSWLLPVTCLLDAFLPQAPNAGEFSPYSLRMCRDSHVQACVLLRPVLNVFECFLGVEQAEHKESSDELRREVGLAQEIAKDSSSKTWFLDSLKTNKYFWWWIFHQKGREKVCFGRGRVDCMYTSVGRLDVVLIVNLCHIQGGKYCVCPLV